MPTFFRDPRSKQTSKRQSNEPIIVWFPFIFKLKANESLWISREIMQNKINKTETFPNIYLRIETYRQEIYLTIVEIYKLR
jgi:hypothetical protein